MQIAIARRPLAVGLVIFGMMYLARQSAAGQVRLVQRQTSCDQKGIQEAKEESERCKRDYERLNLQIEQRNEEFDETYGEGDEAFREEMSLPEAGKEFGLEGGAIGVEKAVEKYGSEQLAEKAGRTLPIITLLVLVKGLVLMNAKEIASAQKNSIIAGRISQLNAECLSALHCAVEAKKRQEKLEAECRAGNSFVGQSQGGSPGENGQAADFGSRAKSWEVVRANLLAVAGDLGRSQEALSGAIGMLQSLPAKPDTKLTPEQLKEFEKPMTTAFKELVNGVGHYNKANEEVKKLGVGTGSARKKKL